MVTVTFLPVALSGSHRYSRPLSRYDGAPYSCWMLSISSFHLVTGTVLSTSVAPVPNSLDRSMVSICTLSVSGRYFRSAATGSFGSPPAMRTTSSQVSTPWVL